MNFGPIHYFAYISNDSRCSVAYYGLGSMGNRRVWHYINNQEHNPCYYGLSHILLGAIYQLGEWRDSVDPAEAYEGLGGGILAELSKWK